MLDGRRVGVVGATGLVGRALVELLRDAAGPPRLFAGPKSVGDAVPFGAQRLTVEGLEPSTFDDLDLVFLCVSAPLARELAPAVAAAGAVCIDSSAAFRLDPNVPLVIPEINPQDLDGHRGIIANANCTTIINALVAAPLHREFGLVSMDITSAQAVSGAGSLALDTFFEEAAHPRDTAAARDADYAFNLLPKIGDPEPDGWTAEETKLRTESRKILGLPGLAVDAICTRVGTVRSHTVSTAARFAKDVSQEAASACLSEARGVSLDAAATARGAANQHHVLVPRLRVSPDEPHALRWVVIGDQILKGGALNALQIAQELEARGSLF